MQNEASTLPVGNPAGGHRHTLAEFLDDSEVQEIKAEDLKAFMHYLHTSYRPDLILVLLDTGIQSGECSRLKIRDMNLENGKLYVMPYHVRKTRPRTKYLTWGKNHKQK